MTMDLHQLPPPMPKDPHYVPPERDPNRPGPHIVAEIMPLEGQLKAGYVQGFNVRCDESERVGGWTVRLHPWATSPSRWILTRHAARAGCTSAPYRAKKPPYQGHGEVLPHRLRPRWRCANDV